MSDTATYVVEVWEPNNHRVALASFETSNPPAAINAGDLLDPHGWRGVELDDFYLEVVRVVHLISQVGKTVLYKTCVATRKIGRDVRYMKPER